MWLCRLNNIAKGDDNREGKQLVRAFTLLSKMRGFVKYLLIFLSITLKSAFFVKV